VPLTLLLIFTSKMRYLSTAIAFHLLHQSHRFPVAVSEAIP
jgi:hypothetical protein